MKRCVDCQTDISHRGRNAKRCIPCAHDRAVEQMRTWRLANPKRVLQLRERHRSVA